MNDCSPPRHNKITYILGYAGLIPFIGCVICLYNGIHQLPFLVPIKDIIISYSFVIAIFLSGVHWGQHLNINNKWAWLLPLLSNGMTIFLWLAFITLPFTPLMIVFILFFAILLVIDYAIFRAGIITKKYFKMRFIITMILLLTLFMTVIY